MPSTGPFAVCRIVGRLSLLLTRNTSSKIDNDTKIIRYIFLLHKELYNQSNQFEKTFIWTIITVLAKLINLWYLFHHILNICLSVYHPLLKYVRIFSITLHTIKCQSNLIRLKWLSSSSVFSFHLHCKFTLCDEFTLSYLHIRGYTLPCYFCYCMYVCVRITLLFHTDPMNIRMEELNESDSLCTNKYAYHV